MVEENVMPKSDPNAAQDKDGKGTPPNPQLNMEASKGQAANASASADPGAIDLGNVMTELDEWKRLYGRSENDKGSLKQELDDAKTELDRYRQWYAYQQQQSQQNQDYSGATVPTSITKDDVKRAVIEVVGGLQKQAEQETNRYWSAVSEIKRQPIYGKHDGIRKMIDDVLADPNIQRQLAAGQRSPVDIVEKATSQFVMNDYMRLAGGAKPMSGLPKPPHMEGAIGRHPTPPSQTDDWEAKHEVALNRQRSGNAEEYVDLVASILGKPPNK